MKVLSLFDGAACGLQALKQAGIPVTEYHAFENDKHAITIAQKNHPEIIQHGEINFMTDFSRFKGFDLLIGGSPCQGFSFAGKQLNFNDPRSQLFFEFVRAKREIKPKFFMLENVKMKQVYTDVISQEMGVEPVLINAALVSAQNRIRNFWCNWKVEQPDDTKIFLKDILQELPDCPIGIAVRKKALCIRVGGRNSPFGAKQIWDSPFQRVSKSGKVKPSIDKAACLTGGAHSGGNHSDMDIIHSPFATRRYSTIECERLQSLPDNYTAGVSNTQRYKMLGNGWNVAVIQHIFEQLPK